MPLTDSFENDIINYFMRGQAVSGGTAYLALSTTTPNEDGTGFTEPSTSDGYARQAISLDAPTVGSSTNALAATFGPCTNNNWGTITYIGIFFASSGGTVKLYKSTTAKSVNVGQTVEWGAGILSVSFD